jgi:hypothetical protein
MAKLVKKSVVKKLYKGTSEKVKVLGKVRKVYLRVKDGVKVVRVKGIYRKLSKVMKQEKKSVSKKGGEVSVGDIVSDIKNKVSKMGGGDCGCAGASPMSGGSDVYGRVFSEEASLELMGGDNSDGFPALPQVSNGGKKVVKKSKKSVKKVVKKEKKVVKKGGDVEGGDVQDGGAKKLETNKHKELYAKARKYGVKGRSKMSKAALVAAVRAAQKAIGSRIRLRKRGASSSSSSKTA